VKLVILYDPGADDWTAEDVAGVMVAVDGIATIFQALNHQVQRVPVRHDMRWFNACRRADLVFNLCEGVRGVAQWEDHVVGTLELAGIAYTGCGPWTTAACRRKAVANTLLKLVVTLAVGDGRFRRRAALSLTALAAAGAAALVFGRLA